MAEQANLQISAEEQKRLIKQHIYSIKLSVLRKQRSREAQKGKENKAKS